VLFVPLVVQKPFVCLLPPPSFVLFVPLVVQKPFVCLLRPPLLCSLCLLWFKTFCVPLAAPSFVLFVPLVVQKPFVCLLPPPSFVLFVPLVVQKSFVCILWLKKALYSSKKSPPHHRPRPHARLGTHLQHIHAAGQPVLIEQNILARLQSQVGRPHCFP
jgi:hypothetical protein